MKHLTKKERKALLRKQRATTVVNLPPLWLSSSGRVARTSPMFATQTPKAPKVYYSDKAWAKISYLVKRAEGEVGWLGLVDRHGENYLITDVFVPKQEVTGATTNISAEAYNQIMFECIKEGVYRDNLCYWGHSHVNMDVGPSITDERTTQGYLETTTDGGFFIRGIYNKSGSTKVDVYEKESSTSGWIFECVDNSLLPRTMDSEEFKKFATEFNDKVITPPVKPLAPLTHRLDLKDELPSAGYVQRVPIVSSLYNPRAPAEKELLDDLDLDEEELNELYDPTDPFYERNEGFKYDRG